MRVVAEAKRELEEPASAKAQMLLQFSNLQILRESSSLLHKTKQGKQQDYPNNGHCLEEPAGEISSDLYRFVQCDIKKCAFDSLTLEQNPQNCD